MKHSADLLDASAETFVVAIDLANFELGNGPRPVADALERRDVQEHIRNAVSREANIRFGTYTASGAAAYRIGRQALMSLEHPIVEAIKKSERAKALGESLDRLQTTFTKAPLGAWIDQNRPAVLISGLVMGIGGAYTLYRFRTGDFAGKALADLSSSALRHLRIGKLDVGLQFPQFVPTQHIVESRITAGYSLQPVTARLDFDARFQNKNIQNVEGTLGPRPCSTARAGEARPRRRLRN